MGSGTVVGKWGQEHWSAWSNRAGGKRGQRGRGLGIAWGGVCLDALSMEFMRFSSMKLRGRRFG